MIQRYKYRFAKWMLALGIIMSFMGNVCAFPYGGTGGMYENPFGSREDRKQYPYENTKTYKFDRRDPIDYDKLFENRDEAPRRTFSNVPGYRESSRRPRPYDDPGIKDIELPKLNDVPSRNTEPKKYKQALKKTKSVIKKHEKHFKEVQESMAANDKEKEEADRTNDLIERFWRRGKIIRRSKKAIGSAKRMCERADYYEANFGDDEKRLDKDGDFYQEKMQEYIDCKKRVTKELQPIIADINKKFNQFEEDMAANDSRIEAADITDDLHERLRVRGDMMGKSEGAARFSERLLEAVADLRKDEDKDKKNPFQRIDVETFRSGAKTYRNYQNKVAQEFYAIENDVVIKFNEIHEGMSRNDEEISRADATNNLYTRLNIRNGVIGRSRGAADHLEKYLNMVDQWNGKAFKKIKHHPEWNMNRFRDLRKTYRGYQEKVEKEIPAIEEDIRKENRRQEEAENERKRKEAEEESRRQEERREREKRDQEAREQQETRDRETRENEERERARREQQQREEGAEAERQRQESERLKEEEKAQKDKEESKSTQEEAQKENEANKESPQNENGEHEDFEGNENVEFIEIDIDGEQLIGELENFEEMFNGKTAPSMEVFDRVMETFLGDRNGSKSSEETGHDNEFDFHSDSDEGAEVNFGEDYMLSSYEYRDDKYEVAMDVGRVLKVKKGQMEMDIDGLSDDDTMHLSGISVAEETDNVVIALSNGIEKVLIRSDIRSLENYAAQRTIEEKIYLRVRTKGAANVDSENLPMWGMEKKEANWIRKAGSIIADFMPYVGTSKAVSELIFGYDYIGGEDVSRIVAACAVMGSVIPIPGAAKGMKYVGKWVNKIISNTPDLAKKMPTRFHIRAPEETRILRTEFNIMRRSFLKKYANGPEALKRFSESERNMMLAGRLPKGYIIHHKKPLYRGGNNDYSNLRIIKESLHIKYTKRLHNYERGRNIYKLD